jgi:hypothetical protein
MHARFAIIGVVVVGLAMPCEAVVMEQTDWRLSAGASPGGNAATAAAPFVLPAFSMALPQVAPRRSAAERIFTLPNIAVVLAGLAWLAMVRRRLAEPDQPSRQ